MPLRSATGRSGFFALLFSGALSVAILACMPARAAPRSGPSAAAVLALAHRLFKPLPASMATPGRPITPQLVELGRDLYFDPRLSADGTVSCARCHQPALYGTDGLPTARGAGDRANPRNAPTVLNAALEFRVLWRGERPEVEGQAMRAFIGSTSFGNASYPAVVARVERIAGYARLFEQAFPGEKNPVSVKNMGIAIGAYERTLVTPGPFDRFLGGDKAALSPAQIAGLRTFIETGERGHGI